MIWNPAPHVKHAWSDAKTVWGKVALVLFYSFIWFAIISSAWSVVAPKSQGFSCLLDLANPKHNETTEKMFVAMVRGMNVFWVGFFSYADVGGLQVKNVVMVTFFTISFFLMFWPVVGIAEAGGCSISAQSWIFPSWLVAALVFTLMEEKLGDHGTAAEHQSLVV